MGVNRARPLPRGVAGNVLEGHGFGKLIAPLALRQAQKGADDFAAAIKHAVEAS